MAGRSDGPRATKEAIRERKSLKLQLKMGTRPALLQVRRVSARRLLLNLQNSFKKLEASVRDQASRHLAGVTHTAAAAFWEKRREEACPQSPEGREKRSEPCAHPLSTVFKGSHNCMSEEADRTPKATLGRDPSQMLKHGFLRQQT